MEIRENVSIYVRVSSIQQTKEDKYSIPEQIEICKNKCNRENWSPVLFKELGITATAESINLRPQLLKMLKACEDGVFKKVLVVDQDRLTRDPGDLQKIKKIFLTHNVNLVTQNDTLDFNDDEDDFRSDIDSVIDKREIRKLARRSARGKYQKAKQGKIPTSGFNIKYGHMLDEDDRMIINKDEASALNLIHDLIGNEGFSCYKVADKLNALGIPTRSKIFNKVIKSRLKKGIYYEPKWTRSSVYHLVTDPMYYKDEYIICRNSKYDYIKPVAIKKEPIITREQFEKTQQQLSKNKSFHNNQATAVYILTGKMRCLKCNSAYVGARWSNKSGIFHYYRDLGKKQRGYNLKCNGASIKRDLIENIVKEDIKNYLMNPETVKLYLNTPINADYNNIDKKIDSKMIEVNNLLELYAKDIPKEIKNSNLADLLKKKQQEINELKKFKTEIDHKEDIKKIKDGQFNRLSKLLKEMSLGISKLDGWDWKKIVDKLIDKIEIDSIPGLGKTNKLDIYITYNFNKILQNTCQWTDKVDCASEGSGKTCD